MPSFWDDLKKTVKDGFSFAADKTEEYTKIGKVKVDIVNTKQTLNKTYRELGELIHPLLKKDKQSSFAKNTKIKSLSTQIDNLKKSIKEKETEIETIKKEAEEKEKKKKAEQNVDDETKETKPKPKPKSSSKKKPAASSKKQSST